VRASKGSTRTGGWLGPPVTGNPWQVAAAQAGSAAAQSLSGKLQVKNNKARAEKIGPALWSTYS